MCHSRHHAARAGSHFAPHSPSPPGAPSHAPEPVVPEPLELRASDAERERAVEALRAHGQAGRLDALELEERLGRALTAITRADLAATLVDLPAEERPTAPEHGRGAGHTWHAWHARHHKDPSSMLAIAVLLVAIWAVAGAEYFWPIWPLMWFAFAVLAPRLRGGNPRVIGNTQHTR